MRDHIFRLLQKPATVPALVGIVGAAGGLGLGYVLGKKKVYAEINDFEVQSAKTVDSEVLNPEHEGEEDEATLLQRTLGYISETEDLDETEQVLTVVSPIRPDLQEIVVDHQPNAVVLEGVDYARGKQVEPDPDELLYQHLPPEIEIHNVFANNHDGDWDYEAECSTRSKDEPYTIHVDEFVSEEMEFDQATFTYYKGDDILVDERDTPIYNYVEATGPLKFGHGSQDPNVVYIRNERLKIEYEILLHQGRYEVEVLGYDAEKEIEREDIKHSSSYRFRDD